LVIYGTNVNLLPSIPPPFKAHQQFPLSADLYWHYLLMLVLRENNL
jgi:hypothetical protein